MKLLLYEYYFDVTWLSINEQYVSFDINSASIYFLKVNNENTRTMWETRAISLVSI